MQVGVHELRVSAVAQFALRFVEQDFRVPVAAGQRVECVELCGDAAQRQVGV
jgi:hypothetical protein